MQRTHRGGEAGGTRNEKDEAQEEEAEEQRCRLCLEGEDDGPLVQPCACRGSAKLIHNHCLEEWRRTSPKEDAAYRCGECNDEYRDALSLELLSARLQAERTDGQSTVSTLDRLAQELQDQGKYDEAEPLYHEALEVQRATLGDRNPCTLISIGNLGLLQMAKGDLVAAEPLLRESLEGLRETLGSRHRHVLGSINNLGLLLKAQGDLAAALAMATMRKSPGGRLLPISSLGQLLQAKNSLAKTSRRRSLVVERTGLFRRTSNRKR